jgi:mycofactocin system glycosyltransferase
VPSTADVTVVVPVRDRAAQLRRCLDSVARACPESPVIVVDDGSAAPEPVQMACADRDVTLMRLPAGAGPAGRGPAGAGPAAARNHGLSACATPYVAFVDSDVVLPADSIRRLLGHLADPTLAAVAPRVRALSEDPGLIGGYERRHSSLDMGPAAALVAPGRNPSYVPSTVLVARRSAVGGGFDPSLRTGEDVDLVWRLCRAGWGVRYAPEIDVLHEHRVGLRAFIAARRSYARSSGMLARRHPGALPAIWISPAPVLTWLLALAGHPEGALAAAGWATARRARKLRRVPGSSAGLAALTVARGLGATGQALAHAVRRAWSPPLLLLARRHRRLRVALTAALAVRVVQDAVATRDLRAACADAGVRVLDEAIAAAGTWEGCLRAGTLAPVLPGWHRSAPNGSGATGSGPNGFGLNGAAINGSGVR